MGFSAANFKPWAEVFLDRRRPATQALLHDDESAASSMVEVVDRADVGVIAWAPGFCLPQPPLRPQASQESIPDTGLCERVDRQKARLHVVGIENSYGAVRTIEQWGGESLVRE